MFIYSEKIRFKCVTRYNIAMLLFCASFILVIDGLIRFRLFDQELWSYDGYRNLIFVFSVIFFVGISCGRFFPKYTLKTFSLIFLAYAITVVGLGSVIAVVIITLSSYVLGDRVFSWLRLNTELPEIGIALKISTGLALLIAVLQFSSYWPINYSYIYISLMLLILMLGYDSLKLLCVRITELNNSASEPNSWPEVLTAILLFFSFSLQLIVASKPEIGYDAMSMHLSIPMYIKEHHYWHYDVTRSVMSVIPMASDMAFSMANMIGGEYAARLINLLFLILTVWLCYFYLWSRLGAVLTGLLVAAYLTTPLLGLETGSLFVENLWSLMIFSASLMACVWQGGLKGRWLVVVFFLSLAMSTKVMTVFVLPVFLILFLYQASKEKIELKKQIYLVLVFAAIMLTVGGWPYWVALFKTGNPVFPFMNHIFKSPYFNSEVGFDNPLFHKDVSWSLIYDLTFHSSQYLESQNGAFGFLWFPFLMPALVFLSIKKNTFAVAGLILSIFLIVGVFYKQAYLRYLTPALPFMIVVIGGYLEEVKRYATTRNVLALGLIIVIALNVVFFSSSGWSHKSLVQNDFDKYISQYAPERKFNEYINMFDPGSRVAYLGRYYAAGLKSSSISDVWHFPEFATMISSAKTPDEVMYGLLSEGVDYVISSESALMSQPIVREALSIGFTSVLSLNGYFLSKIRSDLRWNDELLINSEFSDGLNGWQINGKVAVEFEKPKVSNINTLYQKVKIDSLRRYKIDYVISCDKEALFRSQVNWLDSAGRLVGASLQPYQCSKDLKVISNVIIAPKKSEYAIVYVGAHENMDALVSKVSFKK